MPRRWDSRLRTPLLLTLLVLTLTLGQLHPAAAVIGPVADVSVSTSASPQTVQPGSTFDITMTLDNAGPFDAKNVALRIAVPENTTFVSWADRSCCGPPRSTASTPAPGGTGTVNACIASIGVIDPSHRGRISLVLSVRVDPNVPQGQTITTTATVSEDRTDPLWCPPTTYDPVPENNTATLTLTANGPADVAVSASATPDPVTAGGDLTYTIESIE